MNKLANRAELIAARSIFAEALARQTKKIIVCAGTGCVSGGSLEIYDRLKELLEEKGLPCAVELGHELENKDE